MVVYYSMSLFDAYKMLRIFMCCREKYSVVYGEGGALYVGLFGYCGLLNSIWRSIKNLWLGVFLNGHVM